LAIAIDFTASNGNPQDPKSLHYKNPTGELNEYQKAITSVGEIIASYDQTKRFPVRFMHLENSPPSTLSILDFFPPPMSSSSQTYGFGAKIPPCKDASHCFHVSMDPSNVIISFGFSPAMRPIDADIMFAFFRHHQPECIGIANVLGAYSHALTYVKLSGPTNFAPVRAALSLIVSSSSCFCCSFLFLLSSPICHLSRDPF